MKLRCPDCGETIAEVKASGAGVGAGLAIKLAERATAVQRDRRKARMSALPAKFWYKPQVHPETLHYTFYCGCSPDKRRPTLAAAIWERWLSVQNVPTEISYLGTPRSLPQ